MKNNSSNADDGSKHFIPDKAKRSYAFSIWLGALIRWLFTLGTRKFNDYYKPESNTKNLIIGYLVTLLVVTILMTLLIYYQ